MSTRLTERIDATSVCWYWTGKIGKDGYGRLTYRREDGTLAYGLAHRLVWEWLVGPIPKGLTLDHLCRVTSCVCPDHLEVVTQRVNNLRGHGVSGRAARKTVCHKGHPLHREKSGRRRCRTCQYEAIARYQAKKAHPSA